MQTQENRVTSEVDAMTSPASDGAQSPMTAKGAASGGKRRLYTRKIAVTGVFTALSYGLYLLGKFCKLPFIFPSFFDLQFSELPALIAGFVLGPVWGAAVIVLKCLLKMPLTSTALVGEATDIILGLALVVPASLIYRKKRDIKGALLGVTVGSLCLTGVAVLVNRYISVPFYVRYYFGGNDMALVGMLKPLFPAITRANFYTYYLCLSVIPFNLLRCVLICILTFAVYKRLSRLIKRWIGEYAPRAGGAKAYKEAKAAPKTTLGEVLCRRYVPTMWAILVSASALIVAVIIGLWLCLS